MAVVPVEIPGLRYVRDEVPGITRRRRGKGFSFHHPDGTCLLYTSDAADE